MIYFQANRRVQELDLSLPDGAAVAEEFIQALELKVHRILLSLHFLVQETKPVLHLTADSGSADALALTIITNKLQSLRISAPIRYADAAVIAAGLRVQLLMRWHSLIVCRQTLH